MKTVKYKYKHWFPPLVGASAVTLGHTIVFADPKEEVSNRIRYHEIAHIRQIEKLGTIRFYFLYFKEYLLFRLAKMDHWSAYSNISFEIEAREAERRAHGT